MKKFLIILTAIVLVGTIVLPAFADIEFQYGGRFRWRFDAENNIFDGTSKAGYYGANYNSNDNQRYIDQRVNIYFRFSASPNLSVFVRFQVGDAIWGSGPQSSAIGNVGAYGGANVGADGVNIAVRNAYVQFRIPGFTQGEWRVGVQNLVLLDSWIIDDEFPALVLTTRVSPEWKVTVGYIGGQYGWEMAYAANYELPLTDARFNLDSIFASFDYSKAPWSASLIGFFQDAHSTDFSLNPTDYALRIRSYGGGGTIDPNGFIDPSNFEFMNHLQPRNNFLFDLGLNLQYKVDWLSAYIDFVKNLGGSDLVVPQNGTPTNSFHDTYVHYTGWMVDAGATYYRGPLTLNVGGFYTSGPSISNNPAANGGTFVGLSSHNVNWFTEAEATNKMFSEIVGGGLLGETDFCTRGYPLNVNASSASYYFARSTVYWTGYGAPENLWTITTGTSYQINSKTKLSASYWYFGTAEPVPVAWDPHMFNGAGGYKMSSSIGSEVDVYLDRTIVSNLTLTLIGAYLFAQDAFCPLPLSTNGVGIPASNTTPQADDAFQVGARLLWVF